MGINYFFVNSSLCLTTIILLKYYIGGHKDCILGDGVGDEDDGLLLEMELDSPLLLVVYHWTTYWTAIAKVCVKKK